MNGARRMLTAKSLSFSRHILLFLAENATRRMPMMPIRIWNSCFPFQKTGCENLNIFLTSYNLASYGEKFGLHNPAQSCIIFRLKLTPKVLSPGPYFYRPKMTWSNTNQIGLKKWKKNGPKDNPIDLNSGMWDYSENPPQNDETDQFWAFSEEGPLVLLVGPQGATKINPTW